MCKRLHIHAICLRTHIIKHMIISVICTNMRKGNKFFSKTYPSFLTVKEGSTSHLGLLPSGKKRETALLGAQNRYALRLADHQRSSPCCAGWDRLITTCFWSAPCCAGWDRLGIAVYSLQLIVYSLRLISWLFADNLQISCDFLGGFEEYV